MAHPSAGIPLVDLTRREHEEHNAMIPTISVGGDARERNLRDSDQTSIRTTKLINMLSKPDGRYGQSFPSISSHDLVSMSRMDSEVPVLYSSTDNINNMRLLITVQQVEEGELQIQKPTSRKGSKLLHMRQREKQRILNEVERLRQKFINENVDSDDTSTDPLHLELSRLDSRAKAQAENLRSSQVEPGSDASVSNQLLFLSSSRPVYHATVKWQEKVFSPREVQVLPSAEVTEDSLLHEHQQTQLRVLEQTSQQGDLRAKARAIVEGFQGVRICTKVDNDDFVDDVYKTPITTSHNQTLNVLSEQLRVHQYSDKYALEAVRNAEEGLHNGLTLNTGHHHTDLDYQVMYVCANVFDDTDLNDTDHDDSTFGHEQILCRVRWYRNNTFDVTPKLDERHHDSGMLSFISAAHVLDPGAWRYFRAKKKVFRYRIEQSSQNELEVDQLLKEQELMSVLYKYRELVANGALSDAVAKDTAEQQVRRLVVLLMNVRRKLDAHSRLGTESGMKGVFPGLHEQGTQVVVHGDVGHLEGFDSKWQSVEFMCYLPPGWVENAGSGKLHVVTHCTRGYYGVRPGHYAGQEGRYQHPSYDDGDSNTDNEAYYYTADEALNPYQRNCCGSECNAHDTQSHAIGHPVEWDLQCIQDRDEQFSSRREKDAEQAVFSKLFESSESGPRPTLSQPLLCFTVYAHEWGNRTTVVSHGFTHVPTQPGSHVQRVNTWCPLGSLRERVASSFVGGGPRLHNLSLAAYPSPQMAQELNMTHAPGGWAAQEDEELASSSEDDEKYILGRVEDEEEPEQDELTQLLEQNISNLRNRKQLTTLQTNVDKRARTKDKDQKKRHYADVVKHAQNDTLNVNDMFGNPLALFYNRYGLKTHSSGTIVLNLNVITAAPKQQDMQTEILEKQQEYRGKFRTGTLAKLFQ